MRVPDEVKKSVVFVGTMGRDQHGQETPYYGGTGFLVSLPSRNIVGNSFIYLVTAKHVIDKAGDRPLILRVNTTDGKSTIVREEAPGWFFHPTDTAVDVAAVPVRHIPSFDYNVMPTSAFVTDDVIHEQNIGIGDEVFITGLFPRHSGSKRNIPIVRIGNIAMMPEERIVTNLGEAEVYLIEAKSIGGLSGCPVVVNKTTPSGVWQFHLLGMMHGHWDIGLDRMDDMDANVLGSINMGIAIVTPAKKILEVLENPALVTYRLEVEEMVKKMDVPTPNTRNMQRPLPIRVLDKLLRRRRISEE